MTQEQRIINLENEISKLKEELKKNRKANVWKNVKNKFEEDFRSFDWTDVWSFTRDDGETISRETNINETEKISQSIATIVKISLKKRSINYLEEQDEEKATNITKQILEIMKKEREENK